MSSVRISAKTARLLLLLATDAAKRTVTGHPTISIGAALAELESELAPKPRSSAVRKTAAKRRSKTAELKVIRAIVFARAYGRCELDCGSPPTELHHAFGRVRVRQSAKNCLALCWLCHRHLTLNLSGARACWDDVAQKFDRLGFTESATRAYALRDKAQAKAELAKGLA